MNTAIDTGTDTEHTFTPCADAVGDGQPGPLVPVSADTVYGAIEVLLRFDEFFRRHRGDHRSGTVHAQLRAFCAGLGWHPVSGADVLLDQLGLYAWSLQHAIQAAEAAGIAPPVRHPDTTIDSTNKEIA
ncbi:hypothetical protein [Allorhizocola rhizosphaerae]|uniref:hypothetical protein n=1 Tax=Allorhizocola rhizosphaerae TaxID=1872709 RepID=UPI000E3DAD6F|nr:hypothetical protein [Allorhizocola rhizosphaerae]